MSDTKEKILDKALELFNEKGMEYVGMRELAAALGMRIGNITYYFPTKDHLVFAISEMYAAYSATMHATYPVTNLYDLLKRNAYTHNERIKYRGLLLSIVHINENNPMVAESYKNVSKQWGNRFEDDFAVLTKAKSIRTLTTNEKWHLESANSLLGRFWISEAALVAGKEHISNTIPHYIRLLAYNYRPYATKKGMAEIARYFEEAGIVENTE